MTKRILIIEDQEDNRTIMRDLLTGAGFELIEAMNGEEGVKLAQSERPDLILMDIQLPIIDGYEATRQIRAMDDLKSIPIRPTSSAMLPTKRLCRLSTSSSRQLLSNLPLPNPKSGGAVLNKRRKRRSHFGVREPAPANSRPPQCIRWANLRLSTNRTCRRNPRPASISVATLAFSR